MRDVECVGDEVGSGEVEGFGDDDEGLIVCEMRLLGVEDVFVGGGGGGFEEDV